MNELHPCTAFIGKIHILLEGCSSYMLVYSLVLVQHH